MLRTPILASVISCARRPLGCGPTVATGEAESVTAAVLTKVGTVADRAGSVASAVAGAAVDTVVDTVVGVVVGNAADAPFREAP